jgi:hypothetical protein
MNKLYKPVTVTWDYAMSKWPPDAPKWLKQMIGAWRTIDTGRSAGLYNVQQTARFKDEDSEAGLFRKFRDYLS